MAAPCWLAVAAVACLCVPGRGAACRESSVCSDLSDEGRALDCIHYCLSVTQTKLPELSTVDQKVSNDDDDDDDGNLLFSIILALLASKDKTTEADLDARSNQRRSYTMEHFRWGKPPGDKPKQRAPGNKRRSYTMEHFRWGKPPGRKRRPVRVSDSLEGRQMQQMKRAQGRSKTQDRKAGTYRMSHFRWGGSPASKRSGGDTKPWPEELLLNMLRTVTVKDVQRRTGQRKREEEEAGLLG